VEVQSTCRWWKCGGGNAGGGIQVAEMQAAEIENSRKGKWRRRRIYSVEDINGVVLFPGWLIPIGCAEYMYGWRKNGFQVNLNI